EDDVVGSEWRVDGRYQRSLPPRNTPDADLVVRRKRHRDRSVVDVCDRKRCPLVVSAGKIDALPGGARRVTDHDGRAWARAPRGEAREHRAPRGGTGGIDNFEMVTVDEPLQPARRKPKLDGAKPAFAIGGADRGKTCRQPDDHGWCAERGP